MHQTLAALTEPTVTPPPKTYADGFSAEMAKLQNLGRSELKAVAIVAMCYETGLTTYKTDHAALIQYAATMFAGIEGLNDNGMDNNLLIANTIIAWQSAYATDNSTPTSLDTLLNTGRDLRELPEEMLNRIILFMQLKIAI